MKVRELIAKLKALSEEEKDLPVVVADWERMALDEAALVHVLPSAHWNPGSKTERVSPAVLIDDEGGEADLKPFRDGYSSRL